MRASNVRLVYLHATRETKAYLDAIDPVDAEDRHEEDAAGGRREREKVPSPSLSLPGCPQNPSGPHFGQDDGHACPDQCYGLPCPGV